MNNLRLKRLEAYGFKSFAEKIDIEFDNGITAIVGPNGSGKSNITDAIKWILGEQNVRNLRGTKAEDVIFKGSSTRRALGIAEASLTFANDGDLPVPYEEVIITRRLYRSGESEFFINKGRCRLKDIHLLLADTGLGRDGVSVIGQNHIDGILNSRPEERRLFFEETAGITKYKSKKNEAAHKLEETQANLLRVSDILSELSTRLVPLCEQAEKAKKYQALQQRMLAYRATELCRKHDDAAGELQKLDQQIEQQTDKSVAVETEAHSLEAESQQKSVLLLQLEKKIQEQEKQSAELQHCIEAKSKERAVIEERQRQGQLQNEQLREQINKIEEELATAGHEKQNVSRQQENCRQQIEAAGAELQASKISAAEQAEVLRNLEADSREKQKELDSLTAQLTAKKEEAKLLEQENSFSQSRQEDAANNLAALAKEKDAARQEQDDLKAEIDKYLKRQNTLQQSLTEAASHKEQNLQQARLQAEQLEKLKGILHQQEARLEVLQKLQTSYEGLGRAVKVVLQAREPWRKDIFGVAAELVNTRQEYSRALGVALGGSQEHLVTGTEEAAKQAIAYLKVNKAGRATFLPLPSLRSKRPSFKVQGNGVLGYFNELVEVEERFAGLADYLLGRTVLVDTLPNALSLAKRYNYSLRIVTLEGELLNPGGSLTGGFLRQQENNYFSRRKELESLQQALGKDRAAVVKSQNDLAALEAENTALGRQMENLRQEQAQINVKMAEYSVQASQLQQSIDKFAAGMHELKSQMQTAGESFAAAQRRAVLARRAWRELEQAQAVKEKELCTAGQRAAEARNAADALAKAVNDSEMQLAVLQQNELRFREIVLLHEKEIKRLKQRQQEAQEAVGNLHQAEAEEKAALAALHESIAGLDKEIAAAKLAFTKLYQEKMQQLAEQQNLAQAQKQAANRLKIVQEELHKLELQKSRLQFSLEQCQKDLTDELQLEYFQAKELCLDLPDEEIATTILAIRKNINELGTVNMQAVEEYEATKKRFEFLTAQSDDLNNAKNNLEKLIREMEHVMAVQFQDAFSKIKGYFQETFQTLFGGGSADVYLTDESDVLHSGVNITVQVPDKKAQNLIALSGGERSLTVVALLLAFLRFKPAPFSVLDEIDAALDEANIVRFASYVKEFSTKTQFIIVTHRKGTMTTADVMYGVTMEVPGVSKIISVKMQTATQG